MTWVDSGAVVLAEGALGVRDRQHTSRDRTAVKANRILITSLEFMELIVLLPRVI
jgi:hypothetical protein